MNFRSAAAAALAMALAATAGCSLGETITRTAGTASPASSAGAPASELDQLLRAPAAEFERVPEQPPATGAAPGAFVTSPTGSRCTLGPAIRTVAGAAAFLTAGHCAKPGGRVGWRHALGNLR